MRRFFLVYGMNAAVAVGTGSLLSCAVLNAAADPLWVGLNLAMYFLPAVLSPLVGALVDAHSTRRIYFCSTLARAALVAGFAAVVSWCRQPAPVLLLFISFAIGAVKLPQTPLFRKVFTSLIADGTYVSASARYGAVGVVSGLSGILLAGVAVVSLGAPIGLWVSAAAFGLLALLGAVLTNLQPAFLRDRARWDMSGYRILVQTPMLREALTLSMALVFIATPIQAMYPQAVMTWRWGAAAYSWILVTMALGGLVYGAAGKSLRLDRMGLSWGLPIVVAFATVVVLLPRLAHWPVFFFVAVSLSGMLEVAGESVCYAGVHRALSADVQGRAFSVISGFETLTMAAGFGLSGLLVSATGLQTAVLTIVSLGTVIATSSLLSVHERAGEPV
jgi:MFS family permease